VGGLDAGYHSRISSILLQQHNFFASENPFTQFQKPAAQSKGHSSSYVGDGVGDDVGVDVGDGDGAGHWVPIANSFGSEGFNLPTGAKQQHMIV
jgi:hypothetical protein